MLQLIKKLFGIKTIDYAELVSRGAIILDVRTRHEFSSGHLKGSVNVPLQDLALALQKMDLGRTIITCCASGMRSSSAKQILTSKGFEAYNGGSWLSLQSKLKK